MGGVKSHRECAGTQQMLFVHVFVQKQLLMQQHLYATARAFLKSELCFNSLPPCKQDRRERRAGKCSVVL